MKCRGPAGIVLLAAIFWAPAAVRGESDRINDVVRAVQAAHEKGDHATIERLARTTRNDLWLITEHLCANGGIEAAAILAKAAPDAGIYEKLPDYVTWRRANPIASETFWAFNAAVVLRVQGKLEESLAAMEAVKGLDGITGIRRLHTRSAIYALQKRPAAEQLAAFQASANASADVGWVGAAFHHMRMAIGVADGAAMHDLAARMSVATLDIVKSPKLRWPRRWLTWAAARAYQKQGDFAPAIVHAKKSLALSRGLKERRYSLRTLIQLEIEAGYRRDARAHLNEARKLHLEIGDRDGLAASDLHLASLDAMEGRYTSSLAKLDSVLRHLEKTGSKGVIRGANLHAGKIWLHLRDWPRARKHLRRAREAGKGLGFNDSSLLHFEALAYLQEQRPADAEKAIRASIAAAKGASLDSRIQARLTLANALANQGRLDEAYAEIGVVHKLVGPETTPATRVHVLSTECRVLAAQGKYDEAIEVGQRAQALFVPGLAGPLDAMLESRIATAWLAKGEPRRALEALDHAIRLVVHVSGGLPDQVGAQHRAGLANTFSLAVTAAAAVPDPAKLFELSETARAVALRTRMDAGEIVHRSLAPELRDRRVALEESELRAVHAYRQALRGNDGARAAKALASLNEVRADLERHREHVRSKSAVAGQVLSPEVDGLAATQKRLAKDEVVVVYARGIARVHALVIERTRTRHIPLGQRGEIEALIRRAVFEDATASTAASEAALRAALVAPLSLPAGTRRIAVVPGGDLAWVPFAALWRDRDVVLLPSVTVGRMLRQETPPSRGVLAVGDARPALGDALPATEAEAKVVGSRVLVGDGATEAALRAELERETPWRSVHLACHGLIDPVHPLRSALSLRASKDQDGLWTVSEILETSVRTELVALSACSTARGKAFGQEGVVGFVHAFFVSGAKRVLVSLWDVDDEATAALMTHLHAAWKPGTDAATALRVAQAKLRKDKRWAHPAYWAGWQLWGAP